MDFLRPWILLLLLPAVALAVSLSGRSRSSLSRQRRVPVVWLRIAALSSLVLGAAGPLPPIGQARLAVAVLADRSLSAASRAEPEADRILAGSEKLLRKGDRLTVIGFGKSAEVAGRDDGVIRWPEIPETMRMETDIGSAIQAAAAVLPESAQGRILLISDGKETAGSAHHAARLAAGRGIEIHCLDIAPGKESPDAAALDLARPEVTPRSGEPFPVEILVRSTGPMAATLRIFQDGLLREERAVDLTGETDRFTVPGLRIDGSTSLLEVEVAASGDSEPRNDRLRTVLAASSPPRVLVIDPYPDRVAAFLQALAFSKIAAEVRPAAGFPKTTAEMEAFDAILASDTPAAALAPEAADALAQWIRKRGGGLILAGGENGFGAGGYRESPIAPLLPVECLHPDREEDPSVALLVLLDRSGSMAVEAEGRPKIELATEGALMAAQLLRPRDLFGLVAVDTRPQTVIPLGRVGPSQPGGASLPAINAGGGGIYIYTALAEAARTLREAAAAARHAILFADAADSEEKTASEVGARGAAGGSALDLAAALRTNRIALSVVALGKPDDRDTAFLRDLAARGGGRFYLTSDALTVPQLFTSETMRIARGGVSEAPFLPVAGIWTAETDGIDWAQAPPLSGFNRTLPKPGADPALLTPDGVPLYASWRVGLGRVAAFTSDIHGRWSADWLAWSGFTRFWTQTIRAVARPPQSGQLELRVAASGDRLLAELKAVDPDGNFVPGLAPTLAVAADGAPIRPVAFRESGPGLYETLLEKPDAAFAAFTASTSDGQLAGPVTWTRMVSRELLPEGAPSGLLAKIAGLTGGSVGPTPEILFGRRDRKSVVRRDASEFFLALGLACLLAEWAIRRWPSGRKSAGG